MHGYVSKRAKMHIKPTGGTNKHGKHIIARSRKRERYAQSNRHCGDGSQMVTDVTIQLQTPLRVSNVAKPRTRETNTSKHRNKQA